MNKLGGTERGWPERKFEKEEILQVDRDMEEDRALGPDSFSMAFFHHRWRVVEKDVLTVFKEFCQYSKFEKSLNITFITLVPKKNDASNVRDFRHISLARSVYIKSCLGYWQTIEGVLDWLISET